MEAFGVTNMFGSDDSDDDYDPTTMLNTVVVSIQMPKTMTNMLHGTTVRVILMIQVEAVAAQL